MDEEAVPDILCVEASTFGFSLIISWADGNQDDINIETIINSPRFEPVLEFYKPENQRGAETFRAVKVLPNRQGVCWSIQKYGDTKEYEVKINKGILYLLARIERGHYRLVLSKIETSIRDKSSLQLEPDELFYIMDRINRDELRITELHHQLLETHSRIEAAEKCYDGERDKKKGALEAAKIMGWNSGKKTKKHHPVQLFIIYKDIVDEKRDSAPITEDIKREALLTMKQIFSFPTFAAVSKAVQIGHAQIKRENPQDTSISGYLPSNFPPPYQDSEK